MTSIFLSYASEDRDRVQLLVEALEDDGFTVWWDRQIRPGPSFDREIERAVAEAACMVVVWTAGSVESEWVRSEVEEGVRRGILVPVLLDDVLPPLAHRRRQAANLADWRGERDGDYAKLLAGIRATFEAPGIEVAGRSHQAASPHGGPSGHRRVRRIALPRAIGVAVVSALIAGTLGWVLSDSSRAAPPAVSTLPVRFELAYPEGTSAVANVLSPMALTPDGASLVFVATRGNNDREYLVRPLSELRSRSLGVPPGTYGSLWVSPSGEWVVFNDAATNTYRKVRLDGGASVAIMSHGLDAVGSIRGISWGQDDRLVFADEAGLSLIPAAGGAVEALTRPPAGTIHRNPSWTLDGSAVLFSESTNENDDAFVQVVDLASGKVKPLIAGDRPVMTPSGHLLAAREGVLWASAFDADALEVRGAPMPVLEGLDERIPAYSVAHDGTLVYVRAVSEELLAHELLWTTRDGGIQVLPLVLPTIGMPRLSPDERSLLLYSDDGALDVWRHSLDKSTTTKLTFTPELSVDPSWTADGARFLYSEGPAGALDLHVASADGAGTSERLTEGAAARSAVMAPDGETIAFLHCGAEGCDLARTRGTDGGFEVLMATAFEERSPELSVDGNWIAYSSDESGKREVYVRPFPRLDDGRWQISTNGGEAPVWSRSGERLYFVASDSAQLMSVDVTFEPQFLASSPVPVMDVAAYDWRTGSLSERSFDISSDEERFLMVRRKAAPGGFVVVLDWFGELERLVPTR